MTQEAIRTPVRRGGGGWGPAGGAPPQLLGPYMAAQEGPPADRVKHWWRCTGGGAHSHAWGACMCDKLRQWRRQGVPGFPSRCVAAHTRATALLATCAASPQPDPRRDFLALPAICSEGVMPHLTAYGVWYAGAAGDDDHWAWRLPYRLLGHPHLQGVQRGRWCRRGAGPPLMGCTRHEQRV